MAEELIENGINREELLENISEIFIRYGIRSSSMDDIARYLKMSKKTLYGMFENKNDVVDQVIQHRKSVQAIYFDQLNLATIDTIPYLFSHVNRAMEKFTSQAETPNNIYDVKKYYPELYRKHFQEVSQNSISVIHTFFEKGIADGVFRKEINKELQSYLFFLQILSLADPETNCSPKFNTNDIVATITENFIRSIATSKGIAQL
jgi:AcrR family transcriptional regulator